MRHALDDAVWNVLELAYPADNKVSNLKIAIGLACCAIGALAYYPPIPHPDNIPLVSFLIGLFVVLYGGLNAYVMFINGDWLFVSTPLSKRNNAVLKVATDMDIVSGDYTANIYLGTTNTPFSTNIQAVFDSNGRFARKTFATAFLAHLKSVVSPSSSSSSSSSKKKR